MLPGRPNHGGPVFAPVKVAPESAATGKKRGT